MRDKWRPQRESNPHPQIDNLVSWPLDDEDRKLVDSAGFEPASSACEADALPLDDKPIGCGCWTCTNLLGL